MTMLQYVPMDRMVLVISDGRKTMARPEVLSELDGDIADTVLDAISNPGQQFVVPARSYARGCRKCNYGKLGVKQ